MAWNFSNKEQEPKKAAETSTDDINVGGRINNKGKYRKIHGGLDHLNAKRWKLVQNSSK